MPDEDKLNSAQGDANQSSQDQHASDDSGSGAGSESKTVPLKALHEEREKNKKLREENEKLKGSPTQKKAGEQTTTIPRIKIAAKDLMDLTAGQLEDTLNEVVQTAVKAALESTHGEFTNMQSKAQVDRTIAKFAIFGDEDSRLANAALADLNDRMKAEPEKTLEDLADAVAKDWSQYKVAKKKADASKDKKIETGTRSTLPPAGGGAEISHLKSEPVKISSFDDVSTRADKAAANWDAEKKARGEQ